MSAIYTIAFQNYLCQPLTQRACVCVPAEEAMRQPVVPVVTARWQLETDNDGNRRLVRHWLRNVSEEKEATAGSRRC